MLTKTITFLAAAFATLILLWAIGWIWFAVSISSMKESENSASTDAIIVLTGGPERIETGITLLDKDYADKLFISGVNDNLSREDVLSKWAEDKPVPCCITLGYEAKNTKQNAVETRRWIEGQNVTTLRLVTSNYHIPRAKMEFKYLMPEMEMIMHPVIQDDFKPWTPAFWALSFEEYNKNILTWIHLHVLNHNKQN